MNGTSYAFAPLASPAAFPFYHYDRAEVLPGISDRYVSILAPLVTYWVASFFFYAIDCLNLPFFEQHRLHEPEEVKTKNRVTVRQVIIAVLFQQFVQTLLGIVWLEDDDPAFGPMRDHAEAVGWYHAVLAKVAVSVLGSATGSEMMKSYGASAASWVYWWGVPTIQLFFAAFVMDTWQYFLHRYFHTNTFLYRHVHSWHHRLYVPYSFGALYNHPLEGFLFDTLGATIAHSCAFMTMRQGILFFVLSTAKTVDDHCGFAFPWDPLQHLFGNNSDYHDIHHQMAGLKKNFSQPFFISWDLILGTRMTRDELDQRRNRGKVNRPATKVDPTLKVE